MSDKHEIRPVFFLKIPADQNFLLRFQVIRIFHFSSVLFRYETLRLIETHHRDPPHIRQGDSEDSEFGSVLLFQKPDHILQKSGLHLHNIGKTVDITHLKIKTRIFIQVALRIVLFRPEHRRCLEDAVKYAYHHLLVKLRALSQYRRLVEIVELKNIGTALCSLCPYFRGMDLRKLPAV